MSRRRVVVTGLGAVSPLGVNLSSTWDGLLAGKSAARPIDRFDTTHHSCKFACDCWDFDPEQYFSKPEARKLDRYTQYFLVAGDEAMKDSGLDVGSEDPTRIGCILGTGIGGIHEIEASKEICFNRDASRVSPFFIPKMMSNAVAGQAAIRFGLQGTCFVTSSACASASHAIGQALRAIQ